VRREELELERLKRHYEREREIRQPKIEKKRSPSDISTDAAPHIGTKNVPEGSEDFISSDDIENGDEMVELHGNPAHIYKKSSINQWISKRKEQFPRNPIKNPYTGEYINQENIKRYTAKLKTKPKNKDNNGTRRKYGGSKKRKSLRVSHRSRKSQ